MNNDPQSKASYDDDSTQPRNIIFISKATPEDDDFALWIAPRLEAAGYKVFADILCLKYGDRWRKILTDTLYDKAFKMLLCCRTSTLAKAGVLEEIDIANRLSGELQDSRFMVPMRLEKGFRAPFGTAGLQYIDFERNWAEGLNNLLAFLEEENTPRSKESISIDPEWENYKTRNSLEIIDRTEALTSNWLPITELPDRLNYFKPKGAIDIGSVQRVCREAAFPIQYHQRGVLTFLNLEEINSLFSGITAFEEVIWVDPISFNEQGIPSIYLDGKDAHNIIISMFRKAWEGYCREKKLFQYNYSKQAGFHASDEQIAIGKKVPWGRQGERRSAMLRNIAKGKVWNFGASAQVMMWPFPHIRLKARVLFSEVRAEKFAGDLIDNTDKQFRLRRTVCKGWRNKQWHGRLMAFLEMLSGDTAYIKLPLSPSQHIVLSAEPIVFTSPVTAELPDVLDDDYEETDDSVLAGYYSELSEEELAS